MSKSKSKLFLGVKGRLDEDQILLEVEQDGGYDVMNVSNPEMKMEIKTIGPITWPDEGAVPAKWYRDQFPGRHWIKLR